MIKYQGEERKIKDMLDELSELSYNRLVKISTPQNKCRYKEWGSGVGIYETTTIWGRAFYYDIEWLRGKNKKLSALYIRELTLRLDYTNRYVIYINAQKEPCNMIISVDESGASYLRAIANKLDYVNEYFKNSHYQMLNED